MNREMVAMFPSGISALIVDDNARFIKPSSMLLSLLNFKVASCGSPTAALKLFSGDKNKDIDVVLINAEMASTCGFDFRGIVETDLGIPVIYFLSQDHVATGDEADELLRTLSDSTYILRSPLEADDVCDLWMVIAWRKCYLENKAKGADHRSAVPAPAAAVQAFMAGGGSTTVDEEREDEDRIHFKVVGVGGRCRRKRKSGCNTVAGSSATTVAGDQTAKRREKMNVAGEHERDDVSSQQQPAATQKAALPLVRQQQQQQPAAATTLEAIATIPRWNQPAAGNVVFGNTAPATGVANMATTVTCEPEFSHGGDQQQLQQNVCPPLMFGPFPYQGPRPPVLTQTIFGGATIGASAAGPGEYGNPATSLLETLNLGTEPDGHDELAAMVAMYTKSNQPVAAEATAAMSDGHDEDELAAMVAMYTESNQPMAAAATAVLSDGHDELAAMVAMYTESNQPVAAAATAAMYSSNSSAPMAPQPQQIGHGVAGNSTEATAMDMDALDTNSYINYSAAAAVVAPHQRAGHGVAPKPAAARQEVLNNGDTYSTPLMDPNQVLNMASNVNELTTMAGAAFFSNANDDASFMAPQDLAAAPDGDQLAPGALDATSASLMGSPGPGAAMDGMIPGLELEAMFSPDQYDNTMFPLEALLGQGLDDAPVYEAGVDYQQQGGAAGGIDGADDNLDVLDDYLFMDSTGDFNNGRE